MMILNSYEEASNSRPSSKLTGASYTTHSVKLDSSVIPLTFGVKFRPPKLGIEYCLQTRPNAKFKHDISLDSLITSSSVDPKKVTE